MQVKVNVNRYLTKFFQQTGELVVEVKPGATVKELLEAMKNQYEVGILESISSEVELRRYFIVVINGKFALFTDEVCGTGKEIKLIPPISGG